jgi:hypothetical protein
MSINIYGYLYGMVPHLLFYIGERFPLLDMVKLCLHQQLDLDTMPKVIRVDHGAFCSNKDP